MDVAPSHCEQTTVYTILSSLFSTTSVVAGAGAAIEGQRGATGRGAGAERPGRGSGERERPLLPAASAGHEAGDGGADAERAGEQPQTHGAGTRTHAVRSEHILPGKMGGD